jgi:hypothetical protein
VSPHADKEGISVNQNWVPPCLSIRRAGTLELENADSFESCACFRMMSMVYKSDNDILRVQQTILMIVYMLINIDEFVPQISAEEAMILK